MAATQGSIGSIPTSKSEKGRRAWTEKEEEVLLACLKELVAQGYKSDNGFRPGYMKKLELGMKEAFPGTDLKHDPHINSRIQVPVTMFGVSGNYASALYIASVKANVLDKVESELLSLVEFYKKGLAHLLNS